MPSRTEAWRLIQSSFLILETCAATRSAWKGETLRQIPTVIRRPQPDMGLGHTAVAGRLPRHQPGHGLVVCGRFGDAETEQSCGLALLVAHWGWACLGNRTGCDRCSPYGRGRATDIRQDFCRLHPVRLWAVSL